MLDKATERFMAVSKQVEDLTAQLEQSKGREAQLMLELGLQTGAETIEAMKVAMDEMKTRTEELERELDAGVTRLQADHKEVFITNG
jgi:phage-related minor tail protein